MSGTQPLDRATLEAAARWYIDLRCEPSDTALREAHRCWLEGAPCNQLAWDRLARMQERFDRVQPGVARPTLNSARAKRREVLKVLSILMATGAGTTLAWRHTPLPGLVADQRTAVGERRSLQLDDGSQLQLNTATALNIRYSQSLRELHLLGGEILVQTAPDSLGRPFIVRTPEGSVRALGTRFIVRSEAGRSLVCVLEHAVEARSSDLAGVRRVDANQQVWFGQSSMGNVQAANAQADAWSRGMLVADNWRLEAFIDQLQRYRPGYLGCDPAIASLRISGAFHLNDTDSILDNLASTLPVRVRRFSRYWARVESRAT